MKKRARDKGESQDEDHKDEHQQTTEDGEQNPLESDVIGDPAEQTTPTNHTPNPLEIEFEDENEGWDQPPLPPKDYYDLNSSLPDLPPRDYPATTSEVIQTLQNSGDLISDDDYYAQMMNAHNS